MIPPVKRTVSSSQRRGIPELIGILLGLALVLAVGATIFYAVVDAMLF